MRDIQSVTRVFFLFLSTQNIIKHQNDLLSHIFHDTHLFVQTRLYWIILYHLLINSIVFELFFRYTYTSQVWAQLRVFCHFVLMMLTIKCYIMPWNIYWNWIKYVFLVLVSCVIFFLKRVSHEKCIRGVTIWRVRLHNKPIYVRSCYDMFVIWMPDTYYILFMKRRKEFSHANSC